MSTKNSREEDEKWKDPGFFRTYWDFFITPMNLMTGSFLGLVGIVCGKQEAGTLGAIVGGATGLFGWNLLMTALYGNYTMRNKGKNDYDNNN